jgi:repressor LexA
MTMGEIIKNNRNKLNLSQEELGARLGVNKAAVQKWESGRVENIKRKTIQKLSGLFGITPSEVMGFGESYEKILNKLPLYNIPVSAGNGEWLSEGHEYELISLENVPPEADFCLKVHGDSMEPMYSDGDIVFIKSNVIVESGQIGIFYLNNEGYLKMLQGNKLISLN